jgi:hypothetical protein
MLMNRGWQFLCEHMYEAPSPPARETYIVTHRTGQLINVIVLQAQYNSFIFPRTRTLHLLMTLILAELSVSTGKATNQRLKLKIVNKNRNTSFSLFVLRILERHCCLVQNILIGFHLFLKFEKIS